MFCRLLKPAWFELRHIVSSICVPNRTLDDKLAKSHVSVLVASHTTVFDNLSMMRWVSSPAISGLEKMQSPASQLTLLYSIGTRSSRISEGAGDKIHAPTDLCIMSAACGIECTGN